MLRESATEKPLREITLWTKKSDAFPCCIKHSAETGDVHAIPPLDLLTHTPLECVFFAEKWEKEKNLKSEHILHDMRRQL